MRIVFMGTPSFAIPSLSALLAEGHDVRAVVTVPDRPQGRGQKVGTSAVKEFADSRRLPLLQPENLSDATFVERLSALESELFVVVAFRILPAVVYSIPPKGAFNLHASLLPKFRGAAPINWAIMNGEDETGVTTFLLEEKVDTGSIILQKRTSIGPDETAGELADRLAKIGAQAVVETVQLLAGGGATLTRQNNSLATPAPKLHKESCAITWSAPARDIHNFVRGLSPSPCAWTTFQGKNLRVYRTKRGDESGPSALGRGQPGEVVLVGKEKLLVQTGDGGVLSVLEIQQEGKKKMEIAEFLRGFPIRAGLVLGR